MPDGSSSGCGDNRLDPGEPCDGTSFGGATCASLGNYGGQLGCTSDCRFDTHLCRHCGDGTCDPEESRVTCPADCGPASTPNIVVAVFTQLATCIVGDPCVSGTCIPFVRIDGTTVVRQFQDNDNFKGLKPSDPSLGSYASPLCLELNLSDAEVGTIHAAVSGQSDSYVEQIRTATAGRWAIAIDDVVFAERREVTMSKADTSLWLSPSDANEYLGASISRTTDGVLVLHSIYDASQDVFLPHEFCGLATPGIGGTGYSWIPYITGQSAPYQCACGDAMVHEWLHQVDWAYEFIMGVPDLYDVGGDHYPPCGQGAADTHAWFPSSDYCTIDPDWSDCGMASCSDPRLLFATHMLEAHYDFTRPYVGNHCRNGVMDYGETGVDTGGPCPTQ